MLHLLLIIINDGSIIVNDGLIILDKIKYEVPARSSSKEAGC